MNYKHMRMCCGKLQDITYKYKCSECGESFFKDFEVDDLKGENK